MRRSWSHRAGAPAAPAALAVAAGIVAGAALPVRPDEPVLVALAVLAAAGLLLSLPRRSAALPLYGCVLFALAGGARFVTGVFDPGVRTEARLRALGEEPLVTVVGRLEGSWSRSGTRRRIRLSPREAVFEGKAVILERPIVLVVAGEEDPSGAADAGDLVRVRGPVRFPDRPASSRSPFRLPEEARLLLKSAAQIERLEGPSGPLSPVYRARAALKRRLRENLAGASEEDRRAVGLLLALLLGETADLAPDTVAAFRNGGVAHVLAISGLHVGLVALFLSTALGRIRMPVRVRDAVLLVAVGLFAVFAGGRPPVLRAALMIGLYLLARLLGRPTSPGQVLGLSAAILLLAGPDDLFDVGFLLTYAAVFGLSAFGAPAASWLKSRGVRPPLLADAVGATLGAELAVFPVQVFVFNIVPFVSLLSNPVIVPLSGAFLFAAVLLLPALALSPSAATLAVFPLRLLAESLLAILDGLDRLSALRFIPTPPFGAVATCALLLFVAGVARRPLVRRIFLAAGMVLAAAMVLRPPLVAEAGTAKLQALDVGQGDAWLFVTPTGRVLVDGGGAWDPEYEFGRIRLLPKLGDLAATSLDAVILTHPHPDHSRGLLPVLGLLAVGEVVIPETAPRNVFLDEFLAVARRRGLPIRRLSRGETVAAAGLCLTALHPSGRAYVRSPENNSSLVLSTSLEGRTLLLTGDIEAAAERDILDDPGPLRADVLKVAHHGSATSSAPEVLAAVSPRIALIGVGRHNRFGHPSPAVIERLREARVRTFRTDRDGDVALLFRRGKIHPMFPESFLGLRP